MLIAVIVLGAIALVAAAVLYVCSKKFAVKEDPRIAQVSAVLPQANCGGCGFPGCSGMADALVKAADGGSLDGLNCPVGGAAVMEQVADLLGMAVANTEPMVAVVRCNGTCENRPKTAEYCGLRTCSAMNACAAGETACGYGCLGCGDCAAACIGCGKCEKECPFGAITVEGNLSYIDPQKCRACRKCEKVCPTGAIKAVNFPAPKKVAAEVSETAEKTEN